MNLLLCVLLIITTFTNGDFIRGINWFGFETEYSGLMCTWTHPIEWHVNKISELGFNYIRLPFSLEFVNDATWDEMDHFFDLTEERNVSVLLDFHRLEKTHQSSKPYSEVYSFDQFLQAWYDVLNRYQNRMNLHAIDIFNEYQSDNYVEWNSLARQIVSFVENAFPSRFQFYVGGVSWGGNVHFMNLGDMNLNISYTIHKYWFSDSEQREDKWYYSFGLEDKQVDDVMVGEFGFISSNRNEIEFFKQMIVFLHKNNIRDTFFWTWSFNSGDTGGILLDDCETIDSVKMDLLNQLWWGEKIINIRGSDNLNDLSVLLL